MTEHNEQTNNRAGAVPPSIQLEDFIEAVSRGIARAMAAQEDVSGYALRRVEAVRPFPVLAGFIAYPPGFPPYQMDGGTTFSVRGRP